MIKIPDIDNFHFQLGLNISTWYVIKYCAMEV